MDYDAERSSDDSDDSDIEMGTTVVIINGQRRVIHAEHGAKLVNIPAMRNLQIGDGHINVISGHAHRSHHRPRSPNSSNKKESSESRHKHHSEELTDSTSVPTRSDLNHVCNNIGKRWKKLANVLGLSKGQVEAIEVDYHIEGQYEMAYQTLLKWKRQNGDQVTIRDLAFSLDSIGMAELAHELPVK